MAANCQQFSPTQVCGVLEVSFRAPIKEQHNTREVVVYGHHKSQKKTPTTVAAPAPLSLPPPHSTSSSQNFSKIIRGKACSEEIENHFMLLRPSEVHGNPRAP